MSTDNILKHYTLHDTFQLHVIIEKEREVINIIRKKR